MLAITLLLPKNESEDFLMAPAKAFVSEVFSDPFFVPGAVLGG